MPVDARVSRLQKQRHVQQPQNPVLPPKHLDEYSKQVINDRKGSLDWHCTCIFDDAMDSL